MPDRTHDHEHEHHHRQDDDRTMELREERLEPERYTRQAGEAGVEKDVVSERRSVDVPVTREQATVERHPVEPRPASGDRMGEGEVSVPLREDQVHMEKEPVVTEEVSLHKRAVTEHERMTGEVRHEEARVEKTGDADIKRER